MVLLCAGLLLFCTLGFWQLSRGAEKAHLLAQWQEAMATPAAPLSWSLANEPHDYQGIHARGHYLPERQFLIDNRVRGGVAGYHVVTPFAVADLGMVLVDRGWLPAGAKRGLPPLDTPVGNLKLRARMRLPGALPPLFGAWAEGTHWPLRVQFVDSTRMAERLGVELAFPGWLQLAPRQPGSHVYRPPTSGMKPDRHYAYALQWFSFALVACVLFAVLGVARISDS